MIQLDKNLNFKTFLWRPEFLVTALSVCAFFRNISIFAVPSSVDAFLESFLFEKNRSFAYYIRKISELSCFLNFPNLSDGNHFADFALSGVIASLCLRGGSSFDGWSSGGLYHFRHVRGIRAALGLSSSIPRIQAGAHRLRPIVSFNCTAVIMMTQ